MTYRFKPGDRVVVNDHGKVGSAYEIGDIVTILEQSTLGGHESYEVHRHGDNFDQGVFEGDVDTIEAYNQQRGLKVGDRVRVLDGDNVGKAFVGLVGTVTRLGIRLVDVEFDSPPEDSDCEDPNGGSWDREKLELFDDTTRLDDAMQRNVAMARRISEQVATIQELKTQLSSALDSGETLDAALRLERARLAYAFGLLDGAAQQRYLGFVDGSDA